MIKVGALSKGSSKAMFTVKKVTNGQKSRIKVDSRTGRVTIKRKTKKCTILIKVRSAANKNRKAEARTVKIMIR